MTARLALGALAILTATGCTTTLRLTRPGPPQGTFGAARTLSVSTSTVNKRVGDAVMQGLILGEIPVQVSAEKLVAEKLIARLLRLGYSVCPQPPCGGAAMNVTLTQSEVGTELASGGLRSHSRLRANIRVIASDGTNPYDFDFWDNRSGPVEAAPALVEACADTIANRFERSLQPSQEVAELPLEDGGPLSGGVNLLLSGSFISAVQFFEDLTRRQPELDGAWYDLGVAREAQGAWPQALAAYEQAVQRKRSKTYLDAVDTARRMVPVPSASNPANAPLTQ